MVAFPLAPFIALLQNAFEIRIQARNYLRFTRRPAEQTECNIGIWYSIVEFVSALSVLSNAVIIAFSSNFIPKIIYEWKIRHHGTLFIDFALSDFDVRDFESKVKYSNYNVTLCKYKDFRNPPHEKDKYVLSAMFWQIGLVRLLFVVLYQNFVYGFILLIKWAIPDVPRTVQKRIREETKFINDYHFNRHNEDGTSINT